MLPAEEAPSPLLTKIFPLADDADPVFTLIAPEEAPATLSIVT